MGSSTLYSSVEFPSCYPGEEKKTHLALFGDDRKAADNEKFPLRRSRLGLPSSLFELMFEGAGNHTPKETNQRIIKSEMSNVERNG